MSVQPSEITSHQRDDLQDLHGVCWNTDDHFDDDNPEYFDIMEYHRQMPGGGHWYLPHHETLRHEAFATEIEAYRAVGLADRKMH